MFAAEMPVNSARFDGSLWELRSSSGISFRAQTVVLTAPVPQSLAILDAGKIMLDSASRDRLEAIRYHRCIAALAILDRQSGIEKNSGALKLKGEPIQWIGDNFRKGVSPDVPSVTIHSTPDFAEEHWDVEDEVRIPKLLEAAAPYLKADVLSYQGHRWGYSSPVSSFGQDVFLDVRHRLVIAGDGMKGGRVEGAALSGLAAAHELLKILQGS